MTSHTYDVLAIGNAIVDVIADADDAFLAAEGMDKGSMALIDEARAVDLYGRMGPGREVSGGSAGNTAAGLAALGIRTGFVGQVAADQLGDIYAHDIKAQGIDFLVPARSDVGATARCLILVTSDAQRTMNTFLGAAQKLEAKDVDMDWVRASKIVYLEGYLWDPEAPRAAMEQAIAVARECGTKVAFTLSDSFCVSRHKAGFDALIDAGKIDILFANEAEILAMAETDDLDAAVAAYAARVGTLVVTLGDKGAMAVRDGERAQVAARPIDTLVDTTGAGDLFAAGFLAGVAREKGLEESLALGGIAAAEVIQHYGARPEADLKAMAAGIL